MGKMHKNHKEITHKKDVPILVSVVTSPAKSIFGFLKNSVRINGDIVKPIEEKWEADKEILKYSKSGYGKTI